MLSLILLLTGFILLIWGADHFVLGASSLAKKIGLPSLIIGLTVVAFGTSAPELTVSVTAGLKGANALAISNVLGSNLFNLLMVVGGCAIFSPQIPDSALLKRDWPISILATGLLCVFLCINGDLSQQEGTVLLLCFFFVVTFQIWSVRKHQDHTPQASSDIGQIQTPLFIGLHIIAGLCCIVIGGNFCVDSATEIARNLGLSETIIGLTVVAVGTSLPELVTSVVATRQGEKAIALGNVVGSNLFNILLILGISATLTPISVETKTLVDAFFTLAVCTLLFVLAKKEKLSRLKGILMIICYVLYMGYVVWREIEIPV